MLQRGIQRVAELAAKADDLVDEAIAVGHSRPIRSSSTRSGWNSSR